MTTTTRTTITKRIHGCCRWRTPKRTTTKSTKLKYNLHNKHETRTNTQTWHGEREKMIKCWLRICEQENTKRTTTTPPPQQKNLTHENEDINSHQHLGIYLHKHFRKGAVLGRNGVHKGIGDFFGDFVPPCTSEKHANKNPQNEKMARGNDIKIGISKDHWLQRHLTAPFFTKTVFQLSRFRCEISMKVFWNHNHKPL